MVAKISLHPYVLDIEKVLFAKDRKEKKNTVYKDALRN